jgi:hypothetical protein
MYRNPKKGASEFDWRNVASFENKRRVVEKIFGEGQTPDYLWYALGEEVDEAEARTMAETLCYGSARPPENGDIEFHQSAQVTGRIMRVRNPLQWLPSIATRVSGGVQQNVFLYHIGHDEPGGKSYSFVEQWERATLLPGTRVRVSSPCPMPVVGAFYPLSVGDFFDAQFVTVDRTEFMTAHVRVRLIAQAIRECPALADALLASGMGDARRIPEGEREMVTVLLGSTSKKCTFPLSMLEVVPDDE